MYGIEKTLDHVLQSQMSHKIQILSTCNFCSATTNVQKYFFSLIWPRMLLFSYFHKLKGFFGWLGFFCYIRKQDLPLLLYWKTFPVRKWQAKFSAQAFFTHSHNDSLAWQKFQKLNFKNLKTLKSKLPLSPCQPEEEFLFFRTQSYGLLQRNLPAALLFFCCRGLFW